MYEKIITDMWSLLRGSSFNEKEFFDYLNFLYNIINDMCPLYDKYKEKYNKMFIQQ